MKLQEKLVELENEMKQIYEEDFIYKKLCSDSFQMTESLTEKEKQRLQYEQLAFAFRENQNFEEFNETEYFLPQYTMNYHDRPDYNFPDKNTIDEDTLEYWNERVLNCTNPIFKARYTTLILENCRFTSKELKYKLVIASINAFLDIIENELIKDVFSNYSKLYRVIYTSLEFKSNDLLNKGIELLIHYDNKQDDLDALGYWGKSFDLLIGKLKKRISLKQEGIIIETLEQRLVRLMDEGSKNINTLNHIVGKLIEYYKLSQQDNEIDRLVQIKENFYYNAINESEPIQQLHFYEDLLEFYSNLGMKERQSEVLAKIRTLGQANKDALRSVTSQSTIDKSALDNYLNLMLSGSEQNYLPRIAFSFIPTIDKIEIQLDDLIRENPLQYFCTTGILDENGVKVATLPPVNEDKSGHLTHQLSQSIEIKSFFLQLIFNQGIKEGKLTAEIVLNFIQNSPLFDLSTSNLLVLGINYFFEEKYIESIHLIIPQIENQLRNFLFRNGISIIKANSHNGYFYKILDELLREKFLAHVLGENITNYLRVLLSDPRGFNLRNKICHGLISETGLSYQRNILLIHCLLTLGLVIEKPKGTNA